MQLVIRVIPKNYRFGLDEASKILVIGKRSKNPGILGQTDPRRGFGILEFSPDLDSRFAYKQIFEFKAGRSWLGNAPFGWRYQAPVGQRKYPIIDIFAARHVKILRLRPPRTILLGPNDPFIRIFRPQHTEAFPDRIELFRILRPPYYLKPPKFEGDLIDRPARRSVRVESIPNGVRILNTYGFYVIDIKADLYAPSAFWYALPGHDASRFDRLNVSIIHTPNVKISAQARKGRDYTNIHSYKVNHTSFVPFQGEELEDYSVDGIRTFLKGKLIEDRVIRPEREGGWKDELADVFEALISPIPLIGDLYDFSQFVFAGVTGKDFFGRNISRVQMIALGAAVFIPLGLSARPFIRKLARKHPKSGLQNVSGLDDFNVLDSAIAPELRESVDQLTAVEKQSLKSAAECSIEGDKLEELIELIEKRIGRSYTRARMLALVREVEAGRIPNDFLENLAGFNNAVLCEGYMMFLSEARKRGLKRNEVDNALEWAVNRVKENGRFGKELEMLYGRKWKKNLKSIIATANQVNFSQNTKAAINRLFTRGLREFNDDDLKAGLAAHRKLRKEQGRAPLRALDWAIGRQGTQLASVLKRELGDDWRMILKLLRGDFVVTEVPRGAIRHFDNVAVPLGIRDYGTLRERNKFFGAYFEVDHIFEQRFWRNDPRIDSFNELEDGWAIIIPKNAKIMELMGGQTRNLTYGHQEKTRLLNELIPAGMETKFTLQQIYDAHRYVYMKLGAPPEVFGRQLDEMFMIYKEILDDAGLPGSFTDIVFMKPVSAAQFRAGSWIPGKPSLPNTFRGLRAP